MIDQWHHVVANKQISRLVNPLQDALVIVIFKVQVSSLGGMLALHIICNINSKSLPGTERCIALPLFEWLSVN